jgi:GT2 family glycosyltransferase
LWHNASVRGYSYGMLRVSVILVSYNTRDLLRECLASLGDAHEVFVVDNASRDGSEDMVRALFPHVHLIANDRNRGFGAANNQAIDRATGELILLLNSDAKPIDNAVADLAKVFEDPTIVAAGGTLKFPDGRVQNSCASELTLFRVLCEQLLLDKAFPRSRRLNGYWMNRWVSKETHSEVSQVMGACVMFRPVERFDEDFFLYCEDTDLCHRLRLHGKIVFVPSARFVHHLGASSAGDRGWAIAMYNAGKEMFFRKHYGARAARLVLLLNRIGAALRYTVNLCGAIGSLGMNPDRRAGYRAAAYALLAPSAGPETPPDAT